MIQQNASAAEEMASTAGELSSQAELLQGTIAFFKIDKVSVSLCSRQEFPVADALPEAPTEKTATMGKSDAAARSVVGQELLMMSDMADARNGLAR